MQFSLQYHLRRWQTYMLIIAGVGLIGLLHNAYSTTYSKPDIGWIWRATHLWFGGVDPYSVSFTPPEYSKIQLAFPYPFPIVLVTMPLSLLPIPWMATIWALTSLTMALALPQILIKNASPWLSLLPFVYLPFWSAIEVVQVEPVLLVLALCSISLYRVGRQQLAGFVLPLVLLKPHIGIGLFFAVLAFVWLRGISRDWWYGIVLGFVVWWATSLLVYPLWPLHWLPQITQFSDMHHPTALGFTLAGSVLLVATGALAVLGWRRRDAEVVMGATLVLGLLIVPICCMYSLSVLLLPLMMMASRRPWAVAAAMLFNLSVFGWTELQFTVPMNMALSVYVPVIAVLALGLLVGPGQSRIASTTAAAPIGSMYNSAS